MKQETKDHLLSAGVGVAGAVGATCGLVAAEQVVNVLGIAKSVADIVADSGPSAGAMSMVRSTLLVTGLAGGGAAAAHTVYQFAQDHMTGLKRVTAGIGAAVTLASAFALAVHLRKEDAPLIPVAQKQDAPQTQNTIPAAVLRPYR